jgi:hypothetical protein
MPQPDDIYHSLADFIPQLVVADQYSTKLSRFEFFEPFAYSRILDQGFRRGRQRLHCPHGGCLIY